MPFNSLSVSMYKLPFLIQYIIHFKPGLKKTRNWHENVRTTNSFKCRSFRAFLDFVLF